MTVKLLNNHPKGGTRILMLCPDLGYGGAELSFAKVSRLLATRYDVTCVVFNADILKHYDLGGPLRVLDNDDADKRSKSSIKRFLQRSAHLRQLQRELGIQITISFLEGADYVSFFAGRDGCRYASIRGSKIADEEIAGFTGWIRRRLLIPLIYRHFDGIIAVSEGIRNEMVGEFGVAQERAWTLPNFYNIEEIDRARSEDLPAGLKDGFAEKMVLCNVGRLHSAKNQATLLHIFSKLRQTRSNLRLALVGDGPDVETLHAVCASLGLSYWVGTGDNLLNANADIWFLGYQRNPHAIVSRCSAFVFPSRYEGFPNALAEAMLCGVPVIAGDCPHGPREILGVPIDAQFAGVKHATGGLLVPVPKIDCPETLDDWERAIVIALGPEGAQLGLAARERALLYSGDAATNGWFNFVESRSPARRYPHEAWCRN